MKIHALCLVKNEADVIEESLRAACRWADNVYVFDNGSWDGTWELVRDLAAKHPAIVPYKQDPVAFADGLRSDIFNAYRDAAREGDWWVALPADEFYVDDPREFLAGVPRRYEVVWGAMLAYYFTDADAAEYLVDPAGYASRPIQDRLRHYVNHWSELRFFRHHRWLRWTRESDYPPALEVGRVFERRIRVKHYAYRSPEQIDMRLATRRAAIEAGAFRHEAVADWSAAVAGVRQDRSAFVAASPEHAGRGWRERVVPAAGLEYDAFDGRLALDEKLMPPIPAPPGQLLRCRVLAGQRLRRARDAAVRSAP